MLRSKDERSEIPPRRIQRKARVKRKGANPVYSDSMFAFPSSCPCLSVNMSLTRTLIARISVSPLSHYALTLYLSKSGQPQLPLFWAYFTIFNVQSAIEQHLSCVK